MSEFIEGQHVVVIDEDEPRRGKVIRVGVLRGDVVLDVLWDDDETVSRAIPARRATLNETDRSADAEPRPEA